MRRFIAVCLLSISSIPSWSQTNIVQAEYFFDNDLGFGMNNPIAAFGASTNIDVNELIDVSALSIGMHTLGIRIQDDNNVWSMPEYIPVFVTLASATVVSNITQGEYFFDTDPGFGSANSISFASIQNLDINEMFPTGALSLGMHTLNIRIKNEYDQWSITEAIPVFVTSTNAIVTSDIDRAEYFFDTDPGFGAGIPIPVSTAPNIDINTLIPTAAVSLGMHTLNIRVRTINGEWSITESIPVFVDQNRQITQIEHFYNTDPGIGAATHVAVTPPTNNLDIDLSIPTGSLTPGPHTLAVRLGGINNIWGTTEYVPFNICIGANANFSAITTCLGDVTNFADLSINVLVGDTYSWDFDGDKTEDDNTIGSTSFTYGFVGSYSATLTIDRGGCPSIFSMIVDVVNPPTVDAGTDQVICETGIASISGTLSASASNPMWNSSGGGLFSNPNSASSTYTPSAIDISAGSATLTLTADGPGTCAQVSDQLIILISPPITAGAPTVQGNVGQVVNVDVVALSTVNAGDVIQVSIVQNPTKGSVVLQSDNTISYTPSIGTVGADNFQYQICNQCNLCSTGTVSIDILNEPPTLVQPSTPLTAVAGQSITIPFSSLLSDLNNNIDFNSIQIISGPTSNASASLDNNFDLTIDYSNTPFAGTDELTIEVCDLLNACTQVVLQVEVIGEIIPHNGISPNGDGLNDYFDLENIQFLEPQNKVSIFNRWGDKVFDIENYNSNDPERRFVGKRNKGDILPSGVYFYKVEFSSGRSALTGYLTIKK